MGGSDILRNSSELGDDNNSLVSDAKRTFSTNIFSYSNGSIATQLVALQSQYAERGHFVEVYFRDERADQRTNVVTFLNQLNAQCETLQPGEERRVQFIGRTGTIHITVVDFKLTQNNLECVVLDSAANAQSLKVMTEELPKLSHCSDVYVVTGETFNDNVQKSSNMCMYFGFEQLRSLQEVDPYPDLYAATNQDNAKVKYVSWNEMHPRFVKDAESRAFLEGYHQENPAHATTTVSGDKTLKEYVKANCDNNEPSSENYPNFPQKGRAIMNRALDTFLMGKQYFESHSNETGFADQLAEQPVMSNEQVREYKLSLKTVEHGNADEAFAVTDALRKQFSPDNPYSEVPPLLQVSEKQADEELTSEPASEPADDLDSLLNELIESDAPEDSIFERSKAEYQKQLAKFSETDEPQEQVENNLKR